MAADKHTERVNLPPIPAKRYFTIGEVSDLCAVKPHVLRYWEQEFTQLKPVKRRGNRRYYQHHEVLLIRRIRELLYEQGFTINGARNRLDELRHGASAAPVEEVEVPQVVAVAPVPAAESGPVDVPGLRRALQSVLEILRSDKP
ncbi:MerR family transcriptional regulator [Ralstonia sp. A12]|uniref:MerR family transcriptional regulator n=1 Tax=Ralstonia sp. A12 TaxID=1217052 RepID=UPI000574D7BA|nr:MerR family transcriptional regulator [Ralstonia sp. A12]KHK56657.1 MerR family transcriptional regulator [Ralstonia sp. A12]